MIAEEPSGRNRNVAGRPQRPAAPTVKQGAPNLRQREKRAAGQHAVSEGRKRAALWTAAELGASTFGIKSVERHARRKAREAERTWLVEGQVGAELEKLLGHGFYLFHDVPLAGIYNLDHVVLGEQGFHAIETKATRGGSTRRVKTC